MLGMAPNPRIVPLYMLPQYWLELAPVVTLQEQWAGILQPGMIWTTTDCVAVTVNAVSVVFQPISAAKIFVIARTIVPRPSRDDAPGGYKFDDRGPRAFEFAAGTVIRLVTDVMTTCERYHVAFGRDAAGESLCESDCGPVVTGPMRGDPRGGPRMRGLILD